MEDFRRLDLRRMAQIRKLDQVRVRHARRRFLSQHRIIAQRRPDGGRRQIFPHCCIVLVADHQQHRHRKPLELVEYRLRVGHIVDQRPVPGDDVVAGAAI